MEQYKISKLLNDSTVSKFVTKKWIEVNDLSSGQYSAGKNITFKTSVLIYFVVKGRISARGSKDAIKRNKTLTFKNNAPFRSSISKVNAEDLDIAMPMYNLLEYSDNYSKTSGSLWNYYRDEINDSANKNNNANNYRINNNKATASKSFGYKTKRIG